MSIQNLQMKENKSTIHGYTPYTIFIFSQGKFMIIFTFSSSQKIY